MTGDGDLDELHISRCRGMTEDGDLDDLQISRSEECQKMDISMILHYNDSRISRCRKIAQYGKSS